MVHAAYVVAMALALPSFILLRVAVGFELEGAVAAQARQIALLEAQLTLVRNEQVARFSTNERFMYGTLTTDRAEALLVPAHAQWKDVETLAMWQARRDKELRDRLTALERWRISREHFESIKADTAQSPRTRRTGGQP